MEKNTVKICGINTSDLKVLTGNEMIKLIKLSHSGVKSAREKLIKGNLRLVLRIIQRFQGRGEAPDDLFQIGCIGLIKSIDNFDISQNVKFSTYAVPMIIGEIRRYLRDNNYIKVSRSLRDIACRVMKLKEHITKEKNCEPTVEEIAIELNIPKETVVLALESASLPISMYEPVFSETGEGTTYIMDKIGSKNDEEFWTQKIDINESLKKLNNKEKNILSLRFLKGKTQLEVAKCMKISQAQVSRLEKCAMKKVRD